MFSWTKYFNKKEIVVLFLILITGLVFRIINACSTLLWRDEVYIFFVTKDYGFINLLLQNHWDTAHPPLYFIFLHFWQKISVNPFFLRLPSLVLSMIILYLIPILAKKIAPKMSWFPYLSLFFYSFSHTQISLNMVARPYPLVIFFMLISIIIFINLLDGNNKKKLFQIILFSVINFFVFFSDYSGIWLLLSYGIYWFIYCFLLKKVSKENRSIIFFGLSLSFFLCLFWIPFLFINLKKSLGLELQLKPQFETGNILDPFLSALSFFTGYLSDGMSKTFFVVALLGLIKLLIDNKKIGFLILCILFCPIILSYIFSLTIQPIFMGRNLLIINIILIFGVSYFLSVIFIKNKWTLLLLLIVIFFHSLIFFRDFPKLHFTDPPYDWQKMARIISSKNKDVFIYSQNEKNMFYPLFYYLNLQNFIRNVRISKNLEVNKYEIVYFIDLYDFEETHNMVNYYLNISRMLKCNLNEVKIPYIFFASCDR